MSITAEELKIILDAATRIAELRTGDRGTHEDAFFPGTFAHSLIDKLCDIRKEQSIAKASAAAQSAIDKAYTESAKKARVEWFTVEGAGNEQMISGKSLREALKVLSNKDIAYCEKDKWGDGWMVFNRIGKGKMVFLNSVSESTARDVCKLVNALNGERVGLKDNEYKR